MLKKIKILIYIIILISIIFIKNSYSNSTYKINAKFDPDSGTLEGENIVQFTNISSNPLKKVYFRLDLNYSLSMKVHEVLNEKDVLLPSNYYEYDFLGEKMQDETLLQVTLPDELLPGKNLTLKIKFSISYIPKENGIIYLPDKFKEGGFGSWYPRIIPYKNKEWLLKEYDSANYQVKLTIPIDKILITSGQPKDIKKINNNEKQYYFKEDNIRGFGIISNSNLFFETTNVEGVEIKTYFRSNGRKWGEKFTKIAASIIKFYIQKYGFYPSNYLAIVPGNLRDRGGYASNNLIVIHDTLEKFNSSKDIENYITWILSYTIAQQYWGVYVGDSNNYPKWLTTGLSLLISRQYIDNQKINRKFYNQMIKLYIDVVKTGFNTTILQPVDKLNHTGFDWEKIITESKSYIIMNMLELFIGSNNFIKIQKELLNKFAHHIVTPLDFQNICEKISGKKLGWFFEQWLKSNKKLDYGIKSFSVKQTEKGYKVSIIVQNLEEAIMPVAISLTLKNGDRMFYVWEGKEKEKELTFDTSTPIKEIFLDPARTLPDIDRTNNFVKIN